MLYDDSNLKTICHMEVSNMKPLILYYSYHGNTQRIAKRMFPMKSRLQRLLGDQLI